MILWNSQSPMYTQPIKTTIIEGAKKEGSLVVYTSMTVDQAQKILDAFKARYPFFKRPCFAPSANDC